MFGIGFAEIVLIVVIAIVVLGPDRLPELGKTLARLVGEVRKVNREINRTISDVKSPPGAAAHEGRAEGEQAEEPGRQ